MRTHFPLICSLLVVCGGNPIHAQPQPYCSQQEWRLLLDYDPQLMKAFEALDWGRYARLQQQLVAQLSRDCLVALGQQQVQRDDNPATAQFWHPGVYDHRAERYSRRGEGGCGMDGCVSH